MIPSPERPGSSLVAKKNSTRKYNINYPPPNDYFFLGLVAERE
jgi:hypothetical protein